MRKRVFLMVAVLVIASLACGIDLGTPSQPQTIVITATPVQGLPDTATPYPTNTPYPTYTSLPPTATPYPTNTPYPTYTPVPVQEALMGTATEQVYCRTGPHVDWPDVSGLNAGESKPIIGKSSPEWGLWWLVQKNATLSCWVWSGYITTSGDTSKVPVIVTGAPPVKTPKASSITFKAKNVGATELQTFYIEPVGSDTGWWISTSCNGEWESGDTMKFTFNVPPGYYDVSIFECFTGTQLSYTPNFYLENGGSYYAP